MKTTAIDAGAVCVSAHVIRTGWSKRLLPLFITLFVLTTYATASFAQTPREALERDMKIVENVLKYGMEVVEVLNKVDGRHRIARKIGYAKNFKSPIIKPLASAVKKMKANPVMKAAGVVNAGFVAVKVGDRLGEYAAEVRSGQSEGWQTHADAAADTLAEVMSVLPIGALAKAAVYDQIEGIDAAIDERRAYDQASLETMLSLAEVRRQPEFIMALAQQEDFSTIETEEELQAAYDRVAQRYLDALSTADLHLTAYIEFEQKKIDETFCLTPLCTAQKEEAQSRVRRAETERARVRIRQGKLSLGVENDEVWNAVLTSFELEIMDDMAELGENFERFNESFEEVVEGGIAFSSEGIQEQPGTSENLGSDDGDAGEFEDESGDMLGSASQDATDRNDRADEDAVELANTSNSDEAPQAAPEPEEDLIGVFAGASYATDGTTPSYFAIQAPLENIRRPSSGTATFDIPREGNPSPAPINASAENPVSGGFQYLSWGRLNGTHSYLDVNTGLTHSLNQIRWLYGEPTTPDQLDQKTGTASFSGQIFGDFVADEQVHHNAITGGIGLDFDFGTDLLTGEGYFALNGTPQEGFTISGGLRPFGGHPYVQAELTSQEPDLDGMRNSGGLLGSFYGPEAQEIGGAIWYFSEKDDDPFAVSGIFTAQPGDFTMPVIGETRNSGQISGQMHKFTRKIHAPPFAREAHYLDPSYRDGPRPIVVPGTGQATFDAETDAASLAGYDYTAWGKWGSPQVIAGLGAGSHSDTALWVAGLNTAPSDMPRSGTARFDGQMVGVRTQSYRDWWRPVTDHEVNGDITLNADFGRETISGNYNVLGITNGIIPETNIVTGSNSVGFDGELRGAGGGHIAGSINGTFMGPNAEEIGGTWNIGGRYGTHGIFRARQ